MAHLFTQTLDEMCAEMRQEQHKENYLWMLGGLMQGCRDKMTSCDYEEDDDEDIFLDFELKAISIQRWFRSLEELPMACPCAEMC